MTNYESFSFNNSIKYAAKLQKNSDSCKSRLSNSYKKAMISKELSL